MGTKKLSLSERQQKVVDTLKKYPKDMIMFNGCMTGGHGVKFDLRTVESLKRKGVIVNGKLNEEVNGK